MPATGTGALSRPASKPKLSVSELVDQITAVHAEYTGLEATMHRLHDEVIAALPAPDPLISADVPTSIAGLNVKRDPDRESIDVRERGRIWSGVFASALGELAPSHGILTDDEDGYTFRYNKKPFPLSAEQQERREFLQVQYALATDYEADIERRLVAAGYRSLEAAWNRLWRKYDRLCNALARTQAKTAAELLLKISVLHANPDFFETNKPDLRGSIIGDVAVFLTTLPRLQVVGGRAHA